MKVSWKYISIIVFASYSAPGYSQTQPPVFTHQDSLRGSITPERAWWDLTYYHLNISVNPGDSSITGFNTIQYRVVGSQGEMQIDLQPPLRINKVTQNGKILVFRQDGNAWFVRLAESHEPESIKEVVIFYSGKPQIAARPPWDGGFTWSEDENGNSFIATSCQGDGASLWWPCKDHMYDEPDSMLISVTVPQDLMNVSNGRLRKIDTNRKQKTKTYHWFVSSPINNYGVNVNIADYVHFSETYAGEKGNLDCDYYVLRNNLAKAREQFKDAARTLEAFEYWFGPYPFYEDSYKLVEVPYLGMEHQSSVTYGNKYVNGYLGRDLSGTGWGLKFDFIIIHETAHEWFANNITYKDIADMWIHESFAAYSESLYVQYHFGKDAGYEYIRGTRRNIRNDKPIIGHYDVNNSGSGDMYSKGANMLHTLAQVINDDEKWRSILRGLNEEFYHRTVTTNQIENFISEKSGRNLDAFFNQYLRTAMIPVFEFTQVDDNLLYRWTNVVDGFNIPLRIFINGEESWLQPTNRWNSINGLEPDSQVLIDSNFYVATLNY
jgi:aminopeptidase N